MRLSYALLVGAVLIATAGCGGRVTGPSQRDGLRLTGATSAGRIAPGAPATLTFRLDNLTSRAVRLKFTSGCQVMPYIVRRDTNEVVYPEGGNWACTAALTSLELPPSGSETRTVRVGASGDAASFDVRLGPGEYVAYARLEAQSIRLQSEAVSFTVE